MKARINLIVEIIDGEDAGYSLEENRVVDLEKVDGYSPFIRPYKVSVEFVTPSLLRAAHLKEDSAE